VVFKLPWEEEPIRSVIDALKCRVITIETKEEDKHAKKISEKLDHNK